MSKLNADQVRIIRHLPKQRGLPSFIARAFGVHPSSVTMIMTGERWAKLKPAAPEEGEVNGGK